jgi:hypothetical protein
VKPQSSTLKVCIPLNLSTLKRKKQLGPSSSVYRGFDDRVESQVIIFFYLLLLDIGSNCARETNFCILMIHGIFWTRTGEQIIIMFLYTK